MMIKNKPSGDMNRRTFMGSLIGIGIAGPMLLKNLAREIPPGRKGAPPRRRRENPYAENGRPVVVVVRGNDFPAMLARGMALLGGFAKLGRPGSVIIKPNFVFDQKTVFPTTTDEKSVLAVIDLLKKEGFANITVADRRGKKADNGRAGGKFEWSGLNDLAAGGGFSTDSLMDDSVAETVTVHDPRWTQMPDYGVIRKIYDAPLIINMPTLKRHTETNLTCSLKNMMGVLDVPSTEAMHLWRESDKAVRETLSREEVTRRLCLAVAEAASAVNPELTVIDARSVLVRDHIRPDPANVKSAGRLILSGDPLAADIVAARVLKEVHAEYDLGLSRDTFAHAARLGLGVADPDGIVLKTAET